MDGSKFTKPDYKVISSSYVAVFIAGNDIKGVSREELEAQELAWHDDTPAQRLRELAQWHGECRMEGRGNVDIQFNSG